MSILSNSGNDIVSNVFLLATFKTTAKKRGKKNTKTITSACDSESIERIMRMNVRKSNK
jgi:hypothetical protein